MIPRVPNVPGTVDLMLPPLPKPTTPTETRRLDGRAPRDPPCRYQVAGSMLAGFTVMDRDNGDVVFEDADVDEATHVAATLNRAYHRGGLPFG